MTIDTTELELFITTTTDRSLLFDTKRKLDYQFRLRLAQLDTDLVALTLDDLKALDITPITDPTSKVNWKYFRNDYQVFGYDPAVFSDIYQAKLEYEDLEHDARLLAADGDDCIQWEHEDSLQFVDYVDYDIIEKLKAA
jgi:hypothetical protein